MTPPPRRCSVFGGTPLESDQRRTLAPPGEQRPRRSPPGGAFLLPRCRTRCTRRNAGRSAPGPPRRPLGLQNINGKIKAAREKRNSAPFYTADYTRPAHVPALLSVRFVLAAATGRPEHPARLVLSGRGRGRGRKKTERGEKPRTSNRRIFCTSNRAQITEKLRKTRPPDRPVFAF